MKQTTKELAEVLAKINTEGKYDAIIERARNNGYHDHKFDKVKGHPEYGDCMGPKLQLYQDLSPFPELADIRKNIIEGVYDEPADEEDTKEMRDWLLQDKAPDALFEQLGFEIPTEEERERYNHKNIVTTPGEDLHNFIIGIIIKGEVVELDFVANINPDEIEAVVQNWAPRTKEYTSQSIVDYINSKSNYGFFAKLK